MRARSRDEKMWWITESGARWLVRSASSPRVSHRREEAEEEEEKVGDRFVFAMWGIDDRTEEPEREPPPIGGFISLGLKFLASRTEARVARWERQPLSRAF